MRVNMGAMSEFSERVKAVEDSLYQCRAIMQRVNSILIEHRMTGEFEERIAGMIKTLDDHIMTAEKTRSSVERISEMYRTGENRLIHTMEGNPVNKPTFNSKGVVINNTDYKWVIK